MTAPSQIPDRELGSVAFRGTQGSCPHIAAIEAASSATSTRESPVLGPRIAGYVAANRQHLGRGSSGRGSRIVRSGTANRR
jgi:hypothetical protein